jgi:flagella basal body P-ring formation protein FlgA
MTGRFQNKIFQARFAFALVVALHVGAWSSVALTAETAEVTIRIRPVVEIDSNDPDITFADLVVSHGLETKLVEALKEVRLADSPKAGETRTFTDLGLMEAFRPHIKAISESIHKTVSLSAPARVKVSRKSFHLSPGLVEEELRKEFSLLCSDCKFDFSGVSVPVVPNSVPSTAQWKIRMRSDLPKGSFSLPLDVSIADVPTKTYWVTGTVAIYRQTPVASHSLNVGDRLQPEDFSMQKKDVTFATDAPASASETATSVVGRPVSAGQVIWRGNLRRESAVKLGDVVRVIAGNNEWQVTIDGVAQNAGYIGDFVKVKIPRTQKVISGLLKEKGLVEVQ